MSAVLAAEYAAAHVDGSTRATTRTTLGTAAEQARADARRLDARADTLRAQAGRLEGLEGMAGEQDRLRAEAHRASRDADVRRGVAAGFDNHAAQI